jgi:hypothetical protein
MFTHQMMLHNIEKLTDAYFIIHYNFPIQKTNIDKVSMEE